jgi:hypothetical protein
LAARLSLWQLPNASISRVNGMTYGEPACARNDWSTVNPPGSMIPRYCWGSECMSSVAPTMIPDYFSRVWKCDYHDFWMKLVSSEAVQKRVKELARKFPKTFRILTSWF